MHPCCWGNLLQGLAQLVPVFAVFGLALQRLWQPLGALLRRKEPAVKSCCAHKAEDVSETSPALLKH
jgi:hypothetical protein